MPAATTGRRFRRLVRDVDVVEGVLGLGEGIGFGLVPGVVELLVDGDVRVTYGATTNLIDSVEGFSGGTGFLGAI